MKKVLLLTLHSQNNNFGSVLQAFALQKYLRNLEFDVTVLNYQPFYSNGATNWKMKVKKLITNLLFLPFYLERTKRFNKVLSCENLTDKVTTYDKLYLFAHGYDIYMIGSDQVWNPKFLCGQDPAYYFKFVDEGIKVSYAASLGNSNHNIEELVSLGNNIADFYRVSLRENKSVKQLEGLGFQNLLYVLDPVFLLDVSDYRAMQENISEKGYILAYIIEKDEFMFKVVDKIAKALNKKVIQIGGFASKCKYDKYPREAGPLDFLAYIDNADFVITSSFHGTAFSLIYNKQFAVVMPSDNTLRLENILETAGLEDRIIDELDDVEDMFKTIDYAPVNERIERARTISRNFLNDICER